MAVWTSDSSVSENSDFYHFLNQPQSEHFDSIFHHFQLPVIELQVGRLSVDMITNNAANWIFFVCVCLPVNVLLELYVIIR